MWQGTERRNHNEFGKGLYGEITMYVARGLNGEISVYSRELNATI